MRPIVAKLAAEARTGRLNRREFMALAATFGAIAGRAQAQSEPARKGGILRVASRVSDLGDPRRFAWPHEGNIARMVCETLVRWETDYSFAPLLLEGWEVSDDARRYVLKLRRGVVWNNGDDFGADDVIHNLTRWCDRSAEGNAMAAPMNVLIDPETGQAREGAIERVDDHTVGLNLPRPDITLIAAMADYPALIVHRDFGPNDTLSNRPIGTGPFRLNSLTPGEGASLRRRDDGSWWGEEVYLDGMEFIDLGPNEGAVVEAFAAGEIDVNDESGPETAAALEALGLIRQSRITADTLVARMRMDAAPYDSKALRNAVQRAVDNKAVLQAGIGGDGIAGENHHVAPVHPEYAVIPGVEADAGKAREMLAASGHSEAVLELVSPGGDWRKATADVIAAQLQAAGFNVQRKVVAESAYWNDWARYPFSVTNWAARPLGLQVMRQAYTTGAPWNETGHADAQFDALVQEASGVFDADARRVLFAKLQTRLRDNGVIVQPFWRNRTRHHTPRLRGLAGHQSGELHLENVWLEV